MFEQPTTPESHTHPADTSKRDAQDGAYQEKWIDDKVIDLRADCETLASALAWHAEEYPNDCDVLWFALSGWQGCQQVSGSAFIAKQARACVKLESTIEDIARAYTIEVLWPAYLVSK